MNFEAVVFILNEQNTLFTAAPTLTFSGNEMEAVRDRHTSHLMCFWIDETLQKDLSKKSQ